MVVGVFGGVGQVSWPGIVLGIGAAVGYTLFNLLSHRWLPGRSQLVMMTYTFGIAAVGAAVLSLATGSRCRRRVAAGEHGGCSARSCLCRRFAAVVLYLQGIRGLGPSQAAVVSTLEPLFTIVLAWLVLGQTLSLGASGGPALVLGGVVASEVVARTALPPGARERGGERPVDAFAAVAGAASQSYTVSDIEWNTRTVDYYRTLQVTRECGPRGHRARLQGAVAEVPSRSGVTPIERPAATRQMQRINEAYAVLRDPGEAAGVRRELPRRVPTGGTDSGSRGSSACSWTDSCPEAGVLARPAPSRESRERRRRSPIACGGHNSWQQ